MKYADIRYMVLGWGEVEDGSSYGTPALKLRNKLLVRLQEDGDTLVMPGVPADERDLLLECEPDVFYFTDHYRDYPIVLIRLSAARRVMVEPLLRRRWRVLASVGARRDYDFAISPRLKSAIN